MITPMDIHNKTFSRKLRGYAEEEVNSFLEEVVSDYERIYREHREMEEEMDTLKTKLANYEKMESTMSSTLVMAQETAENVKKNAQKEAELIIREAQNEAKQIVANAEASRRRTNAAVVKTEGDMKIYIEKILSDLKAAMAMVETMKAHQAPAVVEDAAPAPAPQEAPAEEETAQEIAEEEAQEAPEETGDEPAEDVPAEEKEETKE